VFLFLFEIHFLEVWEKIGIFKSVLVASVGRKASGDWSKVQNGLKLYQKSNPQKKAGVL
jgi:hypothetical protein